MFDLIKKHFEKRRTEAEALAIGRAEYRKLQVRFAELRAAGDATPGKVEIQKMAELLDRIGVSESQYRADEAICNERAQHWVIAREIPALEKKLAEVKQKKRDLADPRIANIQLTRDRAKEFQSLVTRHSEAKAAIIAAKERAASADELAPLETNELEIRTERMGFAQATADLAKQLVASMQNQLNAAGSEMHRLGYELMAARQALEAMNAVELKHGPFFGRDPDAEKAATEALKLKHHIVQDFEGAPDETDLKYRVINFDSAVRMATGPAERFVKMDVVPHVDQEMDHAQRLREILVHLVNSPASRGNPVYLLYRNHKPAPRGEARRLVVWVEDLLENPVDPRQFNVLPAPGQTDGMRETIVEKVNKAFKKKNGWDGPGGQGAIQSQRQKHAFA